MDSDVVLREMDVVLRLCCSEMERSEDLNVDGLVT